MWQDKLDNYFQDSRFEDAIAYLEELIKEDPNNSILWFYRGYSSEFLGLHSEAIDAFEKALALNPEHANSWIRKGVSLVFLKRYEEAIDSFDRGLVLDPGVVNAWLFKGISLVSLGRYDKAIEAFDRALKLDLRNNRVWCYKGLSLACLGQHNQAIDAFNRALKLNPKNSYAWGDSLADLGTGRYEVVMEAFNRACVKNRLPTLQKKEPPSCVNCEVKGCEKKNIPYPRYFKCPFCRGYFCDIHHLPFHHDCSKIEAWKKEPLPGGSVIGIIRDKDGDLEYIFDFPEKGFPHAKKEDKNKPPGYQ